MTQLSNEQQAAIIAAAEKLVRCKGRYHSEQNYRALAALFGVTVPDLPPLAAEAQEPVGEVVLGSPDDEGNYPRAHVICLAGDGCADWDNFPDGFKLYAAPQPVAVPDEVMPGGLVYSSALPKFESNDSDKIIGYSCFISGDTRLVESQEQAYADAKAVVNACRAAMLNADGTLINEGTKSVTAEAWIAEAKKLAEMYGTSFVVFRNDEEPQCADPRKVVISFTDEGLGYPAAPQEPTE